MSDNNVAALFAGMENALAGARPDTGEFQSDMPPAGDYECWVTGVVATPGKFRQKDGQEFESVRVSFHYTTIKPIPSSNSPDPYSFTGASFNLPKNPLALTDDGARTRVEMDKNRLAGHLKGLLDRDPSANLMAEMGEAMKKLSDGRKVAVNVRVAYRKDSKGKDWPTEKIIGNIS